MEKFIKNALIALVVVVLLIAVLSHCGSKTPSKAEVKTQPVLTAEPVTSTAANAQSSLPLKKETIKASTIKGAKSAKVSKIKSNESVNMKDYEFKLSKDKASFQVVKKGTVIMSKAAGDQESFTVESEGMGKTLPKIGTDLTGDGRPEMILKTKSEKDSCSNVYSMFSIGDDMELIAEIKGLQDGIEFKDLDGDKIPELIGKDCTFLDWWASMGTPPAPKIILSYVEGTGYVTNTGLMKKDPPSESEMQAFARSCKGKPISKVWSYMLDLIYTGNGDTAWKFYDMVDFDAQVQAVNEAGTKSDKTEYLEAFKEHLSTSPYWPAIKKMNNWEFSDMMM
jgi:hypothetical protein